MKRTFLIGLSGLGYFIVSLFLFMPFRMKPIENYNLFALPFFAAVFLFLLYKACTVEKDSRGYLFGYFAGIVMWQLFGETASLTVPSGLILQFSDMNIKVLGGYFYVLAGWGAAVHALEAQNAQQPRSLCVRDFSGYLVL